MRQSKTSFFNVSSLRISILPPLHKKLLIGVSMLVSIAFFMPADKQNLPQRIPVALDVNSFVSSLNTEHNTTQHKIA